jgi:hypothetical protein
MSAWIVSKKHIDLLVTLAAQNEILGGKTETEFGQILWDENYRSVNYRYQETDNAPRYEYQAFDLNSLSVVAQIKQLACYGYQTCETEDYESTPSGIAIRTLEQILTLENPLHIPSGGSVRDLPGWDKAPWGI